MSERRPPAECANCGASIPRGAKSCAECGADERTGWRETSVYDEVDLPDEAWIDGESAPPDRAPDRRVNGLAWYWWSAAVVLLLLLGLSAVALL